MMSGLRAQLRRSIVGGRAGRSAVAEWPVTGRAERWNRPILLGLTGGFLAVWLFELRIAIEGGFFGAGVDFGIYMTATRHWLEDGTWFLPRQLGGPYPVEFGDVLYPPTLLWLTVPFTVLPSVLWWIIPGAAAAVGFARLRPAMWAWPIMAACLAWPRSSAQVIFGNPVIWIVAALFWGVGALALIKPTVIPFAAHGIRSHRWWVTAALMVGLTLPLLPLALQYPGVLFNAQAPAGWLYSAQEWPLLLIPIVAWAARSSMRSGAGRQLAR
jgi:hypothetical protein